jgi:hypothetical protein
MLSKGYPANGKYRKTIVPRNEGVNTMRKITLFGFITLSLIFTSVSTWAAPIVVPNANTVVDGNSNNLIPFRGDPFSYTRYQQIFASSQFNGPTLLSSIAFRRDQQYGNLGAPLNNFTYSDLSIQLSTSPNTPGTMSSNFASNRGADLTTVRTGSVSVSSPLCTAAPTCPFDFVVSFLTPFAYDPNAGDLLFEFINLGGEFTDNFTSDAHFGPFMSRNYSDDLNSAFGRFVRPNFGLVAQFNIPEPSILALLGLGLLGLGITRRRQLRI